AALTTPCAFDVRVLATGDVRRVETACPRLDPACRVVRVRVGRQGCRVRGPAFLRHQPPVIGDGSGTTSTDDAARAAAAMRRPVVTAPSLADDTSAASLAT